MRRQPNTIVLFVALTVALSCPFYYFVRSRGSYITYVQGLMWCPGVAALITAKIKRLDIGALGWRWGGTRYQLWGYLLPIVYSVGAYGLVWLTGLAGFYDHAFLGQVAKKYGWETLPDPVVVLLWVVFFGTIGMLNYVSTALGEEIGWRGLLVPELAKRTTLNRTAATSGAIWAAWHFPILISAPFDVRSLFGLVCFTTMVIGISFPMAWLRLRSGSLWPTVFFHASHNLFVQRILTPLTVDTGKASYFVDETGAGLALAGILMMIIFWNRPSTPIVRQGA